MLILGHRGTIITNGTCSQNSLPAFETALEAADGFETDAVASRDGEIFLYHPSRGGYEIDRMTASEVKALRLEKGDRIPTLREAIELAGRYSGKILNIELKGRGVAPLVLALLQESFHKKIIRPEVLILSSFDHTALLSVREALPHIPIGALFAAKGEDTAVVLNRFNLASEILQKLRPEFVIMPEKLLTPETLAMVEAALPRAQLCGWTVTEQDDYDQHDLLRRLRALPPEKVGAMIVDDPRGFSAAWRSMKNG